MLRTIRFANSAALDRTEVSYATVPFKQGEWDGVTPLAVLDENSALIRDAWVYPFGAKYEDGTYRYGALLARVSLEGRAGKYETFVSVTDSFQPGSEPQFRFAQELVSSEPFALHLAVIKDQTTNYVHFSKWSAEESNGMRLVVSSLGRVGDFVAKLRLYIYNDQNHIRWELDVTGSNPNTTERVHSFDEIHFLVNGRQHFINIRGAAGRGVEIIEPFKHFKLMRRSQGVFGDGQRQSYHGELVTLTPKNPASANSAAAAVGFEMWGMCQDWVECGEAFGAAGHVPDTPVVLNNNGFQAVAKKYVPIWQLMNRSSGNPWDDYPDGLSKTPGQTGGQFDFGVIKGWDVLFTGMGELVEVYRFLATEDAKRPGHYLEFDGSPVTHANHPRWVTWDGITHWNFGVSSDRLGKTDPSAPYSTNGWKGKDWQHFSSNVLYLASLLTGSYQLREQQNNEAEIFLAGHTVPSQFPNWSTNNRGEPRAFGRTHLALLHHNTMLGRQDILDKMMDRFEQVVKHRWNGANTSPVQPWSLTNDPRVFTNGQTAWVPWNNHLGWIGIYVLWLASGKDPEVEKVMVGLGQTMVNWGWRVNSNGTVNLGHGMKWFSGGQGITPAQFNDPTVWLPVAQFNEEWGLAVCKFAKSSPLFDATTQARAKVIFDEMHRRRMRNYNAVGNPFDSFGEWTAIPDSLPQ